MLYIFVFFVSTQLDRLPCTWWGRQKLYVFQTISDDTSPPCDETPRWAPTWHSKSLQQDPALGICLTCKLGVHSHRYSSTHLQTERSYKSRWIHPKTWLWWPKFKSDKKWKKKKTPWSSASQRRALILFLKESSHEEDSWCVCIGGRGVVFVLEFHWLIVIWSGLSHLFQGAETDR